MSNDTILTSEEAARFLKIHKVTLLKHARHGKVNSIRIGRSVRFKKSDLLKLTQQAN